MLPCSKLCIIWHCQVKKSDIDKSFKITGNRFFHSSVTSQLLLSYQPYFVASTCPKDDLRRVLQVKIVLMTFTTNNPWRFKYSHDFEAFSWCFRFQTLQLLNFVATSLPQKIWVCNLMSQPTCQWIFNVDNDDKGSHPWKSQDRTEPRHGFVETTWPK